VREDSVLRNVKDLRGYAISAKDGLIGKVSDLYFDDERWAIRYFVVDTGNWLSGKQVLISPHSIGHPDWMGQLLPVALTKAQVERSPDIDTRQPLSRQHEAEYLGYYGYPYYWGGSGLWGMEAYPSSLTGLALGGAEMQLRPPKSQSHAAFHLQSCKDGIGHQVHATDGDIGHLEDMLVDEQSWAIRYLIVNTSNWWSGHRVLVAPQWLEALTWSAAKLSVGMTRQAIKDAPIFDPAAQLDRQQEQAIYEHYGRPDYWTDRAMQDAAARPVA
jgi:uncharacterized protein YrrD